MKIIRKGSSVCLQTLACGMALLIMQFASADQYQYHFQSAECAPQKYQDARWQAADLALIANRPVQDLVAPAPGAIASRFLVDGHWYAAPATCFSKVDSPHTNRKIASSTSSYSQAVHASVSSHDALKFYSGVGLIGGTNALEPSSSTAIALGKYKLNSQIKEFELGLEKNFAVGESFSLALGGVFGLGVAHLAAADSNFMIYDVQNQMTFTGRIHTALYLFLSDSFKIGLAPGVMATYMKLPAPASDDFVIPSSLQFSFFGEAIAEAQFSKKFGLRLGIGVNQSTSHFMGNFGIALQM